MHRFSARKVARQSPKELSCLDHSEDSRASNNQIIN